MFRLKTIHFVTSNPGKIEILNNILKELNLNNLKIEMLEYDAPEDKNDEKVETIAGLEAKHCAEKFQKQVITTDGALYIEALNGFPGINTAFTLKRIRTKGLLKLMHGEENRKAYYKVATAYCKPGQEPKIFVSQTDLIVANKKKGDWGFGFDPILIPIGHNKTLAEDTDTRDKVLPYRKNFIEFLRWYNETRT